MCEKIRKAGATPVLYATWAYKYNSERYSSEKESIVWTPGPWIARYAKRIIKEHKGLSPTDIAPGTKVYELVEELAKYLPEESKKHFID